MIPIIGLGNPGYEYECTRHNAGWVVLDILAGDAQWEYDKYLKSLKCIIQIGDEQVLLLKPQTFMNESGQVLEGIKRIDPYMLSKIIVVHDEIDLAIGTIKIAYDRGDGGHNGIKSINEHYGGKDYIRLRIGISKTGENGELYKPNVLSDFDDTDNEILKNVLSKCILAIEKIITLGYSTASSQINQK
jgi:PTH1 family peptidyl-tRNA hydrolase